MIDKSEFLELLQQYSDRQQEIKKLEERLKRQEKKTEMVSDVVQNGYKRHAVIFGVDIGRSNKIRDLENVLSERYSKLLECQTEIEKAISTIEDSAIRQILTHRYIEKMNWIQIQMAMGYRHEDKARKKHDRFFEKI